MSKKEIALSYLERGLSVIPVWSPEMVKRRKPKNFRVDLQKKLEQNERAENPLLKEDVIKELVINYCKKPDLITWKEYQTRLPTEDEVSAWFTANPDANVAIVTGKVSNLVVFDLDSDDAIDYAEDEGGFPDTTKVKSGKGYHYYMKYPEFEVGSSVNKNLDIDIRANGGYIVAPPSIHGSGHMYEWQDGYSIFDIDPADCTPWMLDYLETIAKDNTPVKTKKKSSDKKDPKGVAIKTNTKDEYADILKNGCMEGERNDTATRLIGHYFKMKIPEGELWELIKIWNQKNTPPIDKSELWKIFNSVKNLESKNKEKEIKIDSLLDTPQNIVSEYDQNYVRIPFAGGNLSSLEKHMNGGLIGGRFYILGGIPSSGKTALVNNLTDNICLNGTPVLVFSYDDGRSELRYRTFTRFTSYSIEEFNKNTIPKDDVSKLCQDQNIKEILNLKYVAQEMVNIEKWDNLIEQIKKKHNKPPVIMVDYLRKLRTDDKSSDERLRVDSILSNLTDLAKKYNMPILAISELARDSYKSGQRLSMASFKESGNIEYEASWLGILAAVEENSSGYKVKENWEKIIEQDGNVDLIIFKTKRGTGMTGRVPLKIDKENMTVTDRKDQTHDTIRMVQSARKSIFD